MSGNALGRWLFGKLPSHGDFVARGLDQARRDALDVWLTGEMEAARLAWPDDFDQRYMAAPAWSFVMQADGGQWAGGALGAWVDGVGGRSPLVMAAPADDAGQAVAAAAGCLQAMAEGFAGAWDADSLFRADLHGPDLPWQPDGPAWALVGEGGPAVERRGLWPQGVVTTMMELAG